MDIQTVIYWVGLTMAMPVFWYSISQWLFNTMVDFTNRNIKNGVYKSGQDPHFILAFNFTFFSVLLCMLYMGIVAVFFFVVF